MTFVPALVPQVRVPPVPLPFPPMSTVNSPPLAEKPPEPDHCTPVLEALSGRVKETGPMHSKTPPLKSRLLPPGKPAPELARRAPPPIVVWPCSCRPR